MTAEERAECFRQCKWVDEVIVNSKWLVDIEYLDKLNCKYIARDSNPYPCGDINDMYEPFKKANRFLTTKRIGSISTTDLINRVLSNYEYYVKNVSKMDINIKLLKCQKRNKINLVIKQI